MTESDLETMIQSWENLALMVRHISDHPEYLDLLFEKTRDDSMPENWRAAWMIDKIHEKHPELVKKYIPEITAFAMTTKNTGKKRHLIKLISLNEIEEDNMGRLLNFCLDVFTNAAEPVAVRVHAMQVLYNIATKEPAFSGELIELIENEIELHNSPGLSSRGKKLLVKLRKLSG
jgi:hypothetical protein